MRRRTSCLSCFRSRTYCSALPYSKTQVTRSPCSTPPSESAAGCVNGEPASGFDSVYARNDRRVMWPPLRQRGAPAWHPLCGCPVTQSPYYPAAARPVSPHSVASWPWRGSLDDPSRLRDSVVAAVRGGRGVKSSVERSRKTAAGRAQIGTQKVGTGSVWPMKRGSTNVCLGGVIGVAVGFESDRHFQSVAGANFCELSHVGIHRCDFPGQVGKHF